MNQRFPQGSIAKKTNKRIQSTGTRGRSGRSRGQGSQGLTGGHGGHGGHGGRDGRGNNRGKRNGVWDVTGIDSRTIHVHLANNLIMNNGSIYPKIQGDNLYKCEVTMEPQAAKGSHHGQRYQQSDHASQYQISQVGTYSAAVTISSC